MTVAQAQLMARISLQNITKIFDGEITAVSDFSLEVADGEFMVIVGPSGCGKTTTLRVIAGLEEVTAGNIYIGETLVNDVTPKDRDIAMVFQNYALYPHMSVHQNMAFALKMRKVTTAEISRRVREAAEMLGIGHLLKRKPQALSGGQCQRVAVGRAIIRHPRAFLFDEPLSNLDAALRLAMRAELKHLHRRLKTTTVHVTHDQAEAMSLGERICVMCDGVVQQIAHPVEVYDRPVNRFVAGFFGTPPMNFFTGRIRSHNDGLCFDLGGETIELPQRLETVLGQYCGKEMILGVRPENISPNDRTSQTNNSILATVGVLESLGVRTDVYMTSGAGQKFIASVDPHTRLITGDAVRIHINIEKVHIFELEGTGRNVTVSDRA